MLERLQSVSQIFFSHISLSGNKFEVKLPVYFTWKIILFFCVTPNLLLHLTIILLGGYDSCCYDAAKGGGLMLRSTLQRCVLPIIYLNLLFTKFLNSWQELTLLLHREFWRCTKYHTTNKCTNRTPCISLKLFTLNHFKHFTLSTYLPIASPHTSL
jgi:hypothetical protein